MCLCLNKPHRRDDEIESFRILESNPQQIATLAITLALEPTFLLGEFWLSVDPCWLWYGLMNYLLTENLGRISFLILLDENFI